MHAPSPPPLGIRPTAAPAAGDVAVLDPGGTFAAVGEGWARTIGCSRDALHGCRLASVLHATDADAVQAAVERLLLGERSIEVDAQLRHAAGHPVRRRLHLARVDDGRGSVVGVTVALLPAVRAAGGSAAVVLDAWRAGRVFVVAQPVVDLATRRSVRHELLLRLRSPQGEVLLPAEVLPVLLEHGYGPELDRWIVDVAVGLLAGGGPPPGIVEINLSPAAIAAPQDIAGHLRRGLARAGVDPARIICGLSLEDVARDPDGAALLAATLQQVGCRVSLDGAQATPATLGLLQRVPYDVLRVDGELVHASGRDPANLLLLRALLRAVERDGTEPVAAQVQDDFDVAVLRSNGVGHGQGYFLGAPAAPAAALGRR